MVFIGSRIKGLRQHDVQKHLEGLKTKIRRENKTGKPKIEKRLGLGKLEEANHFGWRIEGKIVGAGGGHFW